MADDLDPDELDEPERLTRARIEDIDIQRAGPEKYEVVGESGSEYEVNLDKLDCTCDDYLTRDQVDKCKHIYKVLLLTGGLESEVEE